MDSPFLRCCIEPNKDCFCFYHFIAPWRVSVRQLWVVAQPENVGRCGRFPFDPFHPEVSEWSDIDFKHYSKSGLLFKICGCTTVHPHTLMWFNRIH